jgi:abnormal spindle-like microcephaly-associated protein
MSGLQEATPCPVSNDAPYPDARAWVNDFEYGDITLQKNVAPQFAASLQASKPKRRIAATRPRRPGTALDFAIHTDEALDVAHHDPPEPSEVTRPAVKRSILAQPAQRPGTRTSFACGNPKIALKNETSRTSPVVRSESEARIQPFPSTTRDLTDDNSCVKKPARRRTVYVPSEDTTMPTVWMGVFSPIKNYGGSGEQAMEHQQPDLTGIAAQMAKKRFPRKSTVSTAPRRLPLQQSIRPTQENAITEDVPGRQTGKENLPPGHQPACSGKTKKGLLTVDETSSRTKRHSAKALRPSSPRNATTLSANASLRRPSVLAAGHHGPQSHISNSMSGNDKDVYPRRESHDHKKLQITQAKLDTATSSHSRRKDVRVPTRIIAPRISQPTIEHSYPLLSEDIPNSSLYESNWLAHQEIAITQLVNRLFDAVDKAPPIDDLDVLRSTLLQTYQGQAFVLVQRRLQASILYGALGMTKASLATLSARLRDDLGLKQSFFNLWLDTYDHMILRACAEVVTGRQSSSSGQRPAADLCNDEKRSRKLSRQRLSTYLDNFFIRHADVISESDSQQTALGGLQRTLLRSLMLIKLLDQAKVSPYVPSAGCLFQPTSPYKESTMIVQALGQMLIPAAGNIIRTLGHLEYTVSHVQYPLEEYRYHIENLAVDLRDGVRLTGLVEMLLYHSSYKHPANTEDEEDATTTVHMPTGEVLSLSYGDGDRPLSQHLKFPSSCRSAKLFNVQIALSALSGVRGVDKILCDIKAEHVVDGFREKTIALLWGLVSTWGLGSLIDWADLRHEIRRLGNTADGNEEVLEGRTNSARHNFLLKEWASAAALRKGLIVNNLTTSFADGKAFEAIVSEYEPYLDAYKTSSASNVALPLSRRLADLGCSAQFGKQTLLLLCTVSSQGSFASVCTFSSLTN